MDPVIYIFTIAVLAAFVAGIITAKYVISEAASIKAHVTDEVAEVRADLAGLLKRTADKL